MAMTRRGPGAGRRIRRPSGQPVEPGADPGQRYSRLELRTRLTGTVTRLASTVRATPATDGENIWVEFNDLDDQDLVWTRCDRGLPVGTRVRVYDDEGNHAEAVVLGTLIQLQVDLDTFTPPDTTPR